MSNGKSLMYGLLVGGLLGGLATLLVTPSSGKQVRAQLQNNRNKISHSVHQVRNDSLSLKNQLVESFKDNSKVIKEVSTDFKKSLGHFKEDIEPHKTQLQKEIKEVERKLKQLEQSIQ
ncbi:YtxH domain-containing protein [Metabacillus malikii]|uniref:Gas vesicle protein n=1 Tax=Metabacillus malikii TaxID=1504265 RepID=A0ABT9ZK95_9BACI|nr:YtxH domain-containing protein [Metabacillus malikii]MDQ0232309.1 gas vesicle protein [Metabacillus malikii]